MIYGMILASGKGTRMGNTEMPKQFLTIGNKPIIIHTIEQFLLNQKIDKLIICCQKEWINHCSNILKEYLYDNNKIYITEGGDTRNDSIQNGCKFINDNWGIQNDDIVLTHDAVRPFINQRIINDNIDLVKTIDGVDTAIEAIDTIAESIDGQVLSNIPNRKNMYIGQTPQTFKLQKLIDVLNSLTEEEKNILTDACKAFLIKDNKVGIVKGEVYNIKITTMHDLKLANAIIEGAKNCD